MSTSFIFDSKFICERKKKKKTKKNMTNSEEKIECLLIHKTNWKRRRHIADDVWRRYCACQHIDSHSFHRSWLFCLFAHTIPHHIAFIHFGWFIFSVIRLHHLCTRIAACAHCRHLCQFVWQSHNFLFIFVPIEYSFSFFYMRHICALLQSLCHFASIQTKKKHQRR